MCENDTYKEVGLFSRVNRLRERSLKKGRNKENGRRMEESRKEGKGKGRNNRGEMGMRRERMRSVKMLWRIGVR